MNSTIFLDSLKEDNLFSSIQGMGRLDMQKAFDELPKLNFDQKNLFINSESPEFTFRGIIPDLSSPLRISMAYTDAPGEVILCNIDENSEAQSPILCNDLDLLVELEVFSQEDSSKDFLQYRGNNFTRDTSLFEEGPDNSFSADNKNNVESVFIPKLPEEATGNFRVAVIPSRINADGVPNNSFSSDQDFALALYNAKYATRVPTDVVLVLDRSGSMEGIVPGGKAKKISVLKDAVELFLETWAKLANEEDQIGIVYFGDDTEFFDPSTFPNSTSFKDSTIIYPFLKNKDKIIQQVKQLKPDGCTAMGKGLKDGIEGIGKDKSRNKFIILFSNGIQNRSPLVKKPEKGEVLQILNSQAGCGFPSFPIEELPIDFTSFDDNFGINAIHTIGVGTSGPAWRELLEQIANQTGGQAKFTSNPENDLISFFQDDLIRSFHDQALGELTSAEGEIESQGTKRESFFVNESIESLVLNTQFEKNIETPFSFRILDGKNNPVPENLLEVTNGAFYQIIKISLPKTNSGTSGRFVASPAPGRWTLEYLPGPRLSSIPYKLRIYATDPEIRYEFQMPGVIATGDPLPLSFYLKDRTYTRLNLDSVSATIHVKQKGEGTLLRRRRVPNRKLKGFKLPLGDTTLSIAEIKSKILMEKPNYRKKLVAKTYPLVLKDNGNPQNGDPSKGDGVFSALFTDTKIPGNYSIDFKFIYKDSIQGQVERRESRTVAVEIQSLDPSKSNIVVKEKGSNKKNGEKVHKYLVQITPKDRLGNFLGPGYDMSVCIGPASDLWCREGEREYLEDKGNGMYEKELILTKEQVRQGYTLKFEFKENTLTSFDPRRPFSNRFINYQPSSFDVSLNVGRIYPRGSFSNEYNEGELVEVEFERMLTRTLSVELFVGEYSFDSSLTVYSVGIHGKAYLPLTKRLRPFLYAGVGYYTDEGDIQFDSRKSLLSIGSGLSWFITKDIELDLSAGYKEGKALENLDTPLEFYELKVGAKIHF